MTRPNRQRLTIGLLCAIALPLATASLAQANQVIIRHSNRGSHSYPVYEQRQHPISGQVTIEFVARGSDWANVFVDGRRIFSPRNVNRRKRFTFNKGAYDIKITGADLFDVWAEGYLDVGRNDTNIIVVSFSERGVSVSGDPYTWIPVSAQRR